MSENGDTQLIPYDRMKEQVEREVFAFIERRNLPEEIPPPRFSFEKGTAMVSFALPFLGDSLVIQFIAIAKRTWGTSASTPSTTATTRCRRSTRTCLKPRTSWTT